MTQLHVLAAVSRGIKVRVHAAITALHHESQKPGPYGGLSRTYQPRDDAGDQLPDESTLPQVIAEDVLVEARRLWDEAWNAEATLVRSNRDAYADLVINGVTIATELPATFLLYLEKQLADVYTFVAKLPTLDPGESWSYDDARGYSVTEPTRTTRKRKVPKGAVLYPATKEHPAQVEKYHDDVIEGDWTLVQLSGALPVERKRELLLRITELRDGVKSAREVANQATVVDLRPAGALLTYVFRRERD